MAAAYTASFDTAKNVTVPPGWTLSVVDDKVDVQWTSLSLDRQDNVYIAYENGAYTGSNQQVGDVKLAKNQGGGWQTSVLGNNGPIVRSSLASTVTADGTPHVVYYDFNRFEIKHVNLTTGATETVVNSALNTSSIALAHDTGGHLHVVYDTDNNTLNHATNASGTWVSRAIGSTGAYYNVQTSAIAIDGQDRIHVAYYDYHVGTLQYATLSSGAWVTAVVDNQGDVGRHVSIAADAAGRAYISYYDATNGDLKFATNASGNWSAYTVDSGGDVGTGTSIALDSAAHAHISYTDETNHTLKYATNAIGAWSAIVVDNGSYVSGILSNTNGYTSIAVDSLDKVHISYRGSNVTRYATNR